MPVWVFYNPSPVGRSVGDCSVRAIAKALNIDWETDRAYRANDVKRELAGPH